jgi:hypothetical protein
MINCFIKSSIYPLNKSLSDYCRNSTNESIRKLTEQHNLERNKLKIKNPMDYDENNDNDKPKLNIYGFLIFLSFSMISIYVYKRLK